MTAVINSPEVSQMLETSAGHLIVRQLESHGIQRVYCVPGESYLDTIDGLYDSSINTVVCRQEGGAGIMALAEGRLTGLPGIAMVTRGPGAANSMIAVHTAWQDGTPMILFVGLIPTVQRGHEAFQEFSLEGWFGTTSKRVYVLDDPAQAGAVVAEAMHLAVSGRPGPVIIGLPEEVLRERVPNVVAPVRALASMAVEESDIASIDALIDASSRPLVIAGGEGWSVDSALALASWAETRALPVATDFRSYDVLDNSSSAYVGMLGYGRSQQLSDYAGRADLIIYLGAVRSDVLSDAYSLGVNATTVVVSADPHLVGHYGRCDVQLVAPPARFVKRASEISEPRKDKGDWLAEGRAAWVEYSTPLRDGGTGVDLSQVMEQLQALLPADAIVTYGAGNHAIWPQRFLPARIYPSVIGPKNGAMGVGIPAAVAAALVFPARQVLSVAGDGCFLMNGQELSTAVSQGTNIVILIVDNSCYGTIRQHQEREYPGRPSATELNNPDFAALARAYGAFGVRLESAEGFADAYMQATAFEGPAVIHLIVDSSTRGPAISRENVTE
ncbi:thiamine pyrophosphate-dependent enzyme [Paeniglutamicibacter quisquiliarum]|uniref:thiamine pyrophosphate-dependent enzyme n=1 Tax=Paeniglutamicibacter quisquiliarum TaxID=2849498 RepID=UPI00300D6832